jgi:hypothetical protein
VCQSEQLAKKFALLYRADKKVGAAHHWKLDEPLDE